MTIKNKHMQQFFADTVKDVDVRTDAVSNDLKKLIQEWINVVLEQEAGIEQLVPQLRTLLAQIPESQLSDEVKNAAETLAGLLGAE